MDTSKLIVVVAIILIIFIALYKCPSKEGFKIGTPQMIDSAVQFIPNNQYNPVAGINGSTLRTGNPVSFADMVVSPTPTQTTKDRIVDQMSDPRDYLPAGMSNVYNEDAWNSQRATVRLQNSRLSNTASEIFNIGGGEIEPFQSAHKITDHTVREINSLRFNMGTPATPSQAMALNPPVDTTMLVGFPSSWSVPPRDVR